MAQMTETTQPLQSALGAHGSGRAGASIHAKGITKVYGQGGVSPFHALGPIDLDIKPGEFVSLIGPSGCGKSTTLLLTSGLEPVSDGTVEVDGKPLTKPISEVGIVFQDHLLLDFRTAMQNVLLQQEIRKLDAEKIRARAEMLFDRLGIRGSENKYPRQLSGGMRQRAALARTLLEDRTVVFLDEPFSALDAGTRAAMQELAAELLHGRTVLLVTHDPAEAARLADHILILLSLIHI